MSYQTTRTSGLTLGQGLTLDTDTESSTHYTERTPLLAGTPTPPPSSPVPSRLPSPARGDNSRRSSRTNYGNDDGVRGGFSALEQVKSQLRKRVIPLAMVLIFLLELSVGIMQPPQNAIMESIICRKMHPEVFTPPPPGTGPEEGLLPPALPGPDNLDHMSLAMSGPRTIPSRPVRPRLRYYPGLVLADDPLCKGSDVQGYLATVVGWQSTFDSIPGIVGSVPYGVLSDRWGRRPVMGLSLVGIGLSFAWCYGVYFFSRFVPLRVVWFSSAFQLIGGGGAVAIAMMYTVIADVVAISTRATVFFHMTAAFLASQMIAGPTGGTLLAWNPWIPLLLALALLVICCFLAFFAMPETVHVHDHHNTSAALDEDDDPAASKLLRKARAGLEEVYTFILGNTRLAFLIISMVFIILGRIVGEVLLQYSTDRYGWSWTKASLVLTIRNAGSLLTLLVLLPAASWVLISRRGLSAMEKDLCLARWSGVVQVVGSVVIAAAGNGVMYAIGLVWFAAGAGMTSVVRSLLNALVEEHHVGTVNSLIGFMEMISVAAASPMIAESLKLGLKLGEPWVGLPFITAAVFFGVATVIVSMFRLPKRADTGDPA